MLLLPINLEKKKNEYCTCNLTQIIVYVAASIISIVKFLKQHYTLLIKQQKCN